MPSRAYAASDLGFSYSHLFVALVCAQTHMDGVEAADCIPNDTEAIGGWGLLKQPPEVACVSIGRDVRQWLGMSDGFIDCGRRHVFGKLQEALLI